MKKILTLMMSACMVLMLMACSGTPETDAPSDAPPATTEGSKTTEPGKTDPAKTDPVQPEERLPLVKDGETKTITIGVKADAQTPDYYNNDFTRFLEEKTGVHLEFVLYSSDVTEACQQFAAQCAANEKLPDILYGFMTDRTWGYEFGEEGYFIDLTEYFEKDTY